MGWPDELFKWLGHGKYLASPSAVGDGAVKELLIDAYGRPRVIVDSASAPTGLAYSHTVAPAAGATIKSGAGSLWSFWGFNDGGSTAYVQFHEATGAPSGGAVPKLVYRAAAGASFSFAVPANSPIAFATGIRWQLSSTPGTYTALAGTVALSAAYT